jgi:hypothetical protein
MSEIQPFLGVQDVGTLAQAIVGYGSPQPPSPATGASFDYLSGRPHMARAMRSNSSPKESLFM